MATSVIAMPAPARRKTPSSSASALRCAVQGRLAPLDFCLEIVPSPSWSRRLARRAAWQAAVRKRPVATKTATTTALPIGVNGARAPIGASHQPAAIEASMMASKPGPIPPNHADSTMLT